jgi:hypothetical protein
MLNINFINDLTLKTIHDLLMDCETEELTLQEELDDSVDVNHLFAIAHYLITLNPNLKITYLTEREEYPLDELNAEFSFREIPFETIVLKNKTVYKSLGYQFL